MLKIFTRVRIFPLPSKKAKNSQTNPNRIFHLTIICNQLLNYCISPVPFYWKRSSEMFITSKKRLRIFWAVPLFKLFHIITLTIFATHGPFNTTIKFPHIAPAIFCMNIGVLVALALLDIICIAFGSEIVNTFKWTYEIAPDLLQSFKLGKMSFEKLMGYFNLLLTLVCIVVGFTVAGYIGFIRLDTCHLLVNEFNFTNRAKSVFIDVLCFLLVIHEGQIIVLPIRCLCLAAAFQACGRGCIHYVLSKKSPSSWRINIYSQIRIVSATLREFEKSFSSLLLGFVSLFSVLAAGTLYVAIRKNNIFMAVPAFLTAFVGIVFIQFFFLFGSSFHKYSTILLNKWKGDRQLYFGSRKDCAYLKRILKSLPPTCMPAGSIGIIDDEIKANYFKSIFETMVDTVLTLKDIF